MHPYEAVIPQAADKLDANEYPEDLPEWFKKKLSLLWEKGIPSNRYPDATHRSLKQGIAQYVGVDSEQISIGNGSDEVIRSLLISSCLEDRGGILVAEPTFSIYGLLAQTLGIPVIRVPRDPETMGLHLEACQAALESHPIRALFLVSPNSPTGNALTEKEMAWIRTLGSDLLVVIDEAYFEFHGQTALVELPQHPNWVITRTFSKAFRLATHRVGYAIADPVIIRALEVIRLPYNLPMFSQWAVQLALEHREDLLADIPRLIMERDRLYEALKQWPGMKVWPSDANFLYFQVPGLDLALLQRDWLIQGTCVRHTGGGLRLTVGTLEENQRSLERLQKILQPTPAATLLR